MKIHETVSGDGYEDPLPCCGMLPLLVPSGDLLTEHSGIVTCDNRVPRCPSCNGEAGYIQMRAQYPNDFASAAETVMTVEPCMHEFRVRVGIDMKIRLDERKRSERSDRRSGWAPAGDPEGGQPEERPEAG